MTLKTNTLIYDITKTPKLISKTNLQSVARRSGCFNQKFDLKKKDSKSLKTHNFICNMLRTHKFSLKFTYSFKPSAIMC